MFPNGLWWSAKGAVFCDDLSHSALPWGIISVFDGPTSVDGWLLNCSEKDIDFSGSAIMFLHVEKLYGTVSMFCSQKKKIFISLQ